MGEKRHLTDWALFAVLTTLWASAYAFTRLAVSQAAPEQGFPPELIIPLRLIGGAVILLLIAFFSGQAWPALTEWKSWLTIAIMGILGTAVPFFLITTAQQTVDSSLAALYVSAAPLFVSVAAHFIFHDDAMTPGKTLGIALGFVGVAVLFGPEAISAFGSASVLAQAMCLLATAFYALSTITARYGRNIPPFVFSAGFVTVGAIASTPFLFFVDYAVLSPSSSAIGGVIGLAIGPTAMASFLYLLLVKRTSASFVSLTGYTIPILSAIIGFIAFREVQSWNAMAAFALILSGVWLARRGQVIAKA